MGGGAQYFELQRVAKLLGVTVNALDRRIRRGDLPEAVQLDELADTQWVVHRDALAPIAEREGWIIDLRKIDEAVSSHPASGTSRLQPESDSAPASSTHDHVEENSEVDMTDIETNGLPAATDSIESNDDDVHVVSHGDGQATSIFSGIDDGLNELLERLLTMSSDLTDAVVQKERALQKVETQDQTIKQHETKIVDLNKVIEGQESDMSRVVTDLHEAKTGLRVAEALAEERAIQIDELHEDMDQQRSRHVVELDRHRAQTAELRRRLESTSRALGWWSRRRLRDRG